MAMRTNYEINPRAHVNTTGWNIQGAGTTLVRATTDPLLGDGYYRVTTAGGSSPGMQPTASRASGVAAAGQTWTASCAVRGASGNIYLQLNEYLDTTFQTFSVSDAIALTTDWAVVSFSRTLTDPDTNSVRLVIRTGTGESISWDVSNILLEQAATVGTYFDGDSANAVWTGTAHASTSVYTPPDPVVTAGLTLGLRMGL